MCQSASCTLVRWSAGCAATRVSKGRQAGSEAGVVRKSKEWAPRPCKKNKRRETFIAAHTEASIYLIGVAALLAVRRGAVVAQLQCRVTPTQCCSASTCCTRSAWPQCASCAAHGLCCSMPCLLAARSPPRPRHFARAVPACLCCALCVVVLRRLFSAGTAGRACSLRSCGEERPPGRRALPARVRLGAPPTLACAARLQPGPSSGCTSLRCPRHMMCLTALLDFDPPTIDRVAAWCALLLAGCHCAGGACCDSVLWRPAQGPP